MRVIRKSFGHLLAGGQKRIVALRNSAGVSVTSTKGKLEVLRLIKGTYVHAVWIVFLMIVGKRR